MDFCRVCVCSLYGTRQELHGIGILLNFIRATPVAIASLLLTIWAPDAPAQSQSTAAGIAAGGRHSLAVLSDGSVVAWGHNFNGQLGDGTQTDAATPVNALNLTSGATISAGGPFSVALAYDGTAWTWGANQFGQLGTGSTAPSWEPVPVQGTAGFAATAAGHSHVLAIRSDGTAWSWGRNHWGQLGNGLTTPQYAPGSTAPVQVVSLQGAIDGAAGTLHSLVLRGDGTVWTFGHGYVGQLGNGTLTDSSIPVQALVTNVIDVDAGDAHSLALKADGTVWVWGRNNWGQLGNGTQSPLMTAGSTVPVQVPGLVGIVEIAAGAFHNLALASDGTVWAWGDNRQGQLATATSLSTIPVQVLGLTGVVEIAAGSAHSLARRDDGTVWGWGLNWFGQLGNATTTSSSVPVQTWNLAGSARLSLTVNQPGGPGTATYVSNLNLTPGHEYHNIASVPVCPGGPGSGISTLAGLCINSASLLAQLAIPVGTPPLHFIATSAAITWPGMVIAPVTLDAVCVDVTGGVLRDASPVLRVTIL